MFPFGQVGFPREDSVSPVQTAAAWLSACWRLSWGRDTSIQVSPCPQEAAWNRTFLESLRAAAGVLPSPECACPSGSGQAPGWAEWGRKARQWLCCNHLSSNLPCLAPLQSFLGSTGHRKSSADFDCKSRLLWVSLLLALESGSGVCCDVPHC